MNSYNNNYHAYKKASVNTTDQGTLILMLYDGIIKFLSQSREKLIAKDYEGAHQLISKAKNILSELLSSLNVERSGEIGRNLKSLYSFMYDRLIDANIKKDVVYVDEVIDLMNELRIGWKHVNSSKKNITQPMSKGEAKPVHIKG